MAFHFASCSPSTLARCASARNVCPIRRNERIVASRWRSVRCVASARDPVAVGSVVAVERGRGRVDLARVSGVASDGGTVDVILLKEFVREMYVDGGGGSTYERLEDVRAVPAEYVPAQESWIVLDQDIVKAKNEFAARAPGEAKEATVVITAEQKRELSEEALKSQRGFPKPTKAQALFGAAMCLPIAAWSYSGFAGARQVYSANPIGDDASAGAIRQAILFAYSSGAVLTLVVGSALLLYALGGAADAEE